MTQTENRAKLSLMQAKHPVTPKDWENYLNGFKNGHLDRRMGVKLMGSFVASYSLNRTQMYYGSGYRNGWTCECNDSTHTP